MNNPDESNIQQWLKGELEGNALKQMEAWAEEHAEELEAKMGWDALGTEISQSLPSKQEPPYADFFNERVKHHAIEIVEQAPAAKVIPLWKRLNWILAPAAVAGMVFCFYLGTRVDQESTGQSVAALEEVYTPASGVRSEVLLSGGSTVIVLDGLDEIPDSLDIVSGETGQGANPRMIVKAERESFYF
ncbi:MAG: ferric-dicitrate binding protein FerR (iron transport regulator) [Crocinitomicaceae bacterium]|jgi:ferric-dicitrate binding protein FerR (iron transport regulator)